MAARDEAGTARARIVQVPAHNLYLLGGNDGADLARGDIREVETQYAHLRRQGREEGFVGGTFHIHAFNGQAALPGIRQTAPGDSRGSAGQIRVGGDNRGVFAAELKLGGNEPARGGFCDLATGGHTAGETYLVDYFDERSTRAAIAFDDTDDGGDGGYFGKRFPQRPHEARRHFTGLDERGTARQQGWNGIDERQQEREVPR